jgi:hypothetical protein
MDPATILLALIIGLVVTAAFMVLLGIVAWLMEAMVGVGIHGFLIFYLYFFFAALLTLNLPPEKRVFGIVGTIVVLLSVIAVIVWQICRELRR